jgi:hypothetical protein
LLPMQIFRGLRWSLANFYQIVYKQAAPMELAKCLMPGFSLRRSILFIEIKYLFRLHRRLLLMRLPWFIILFCWK